jgi:hypothetical protein
LNSIRVAYRLIEIIDSIIEFWKNFDFDEEGRRKKRESSYPLILVINIIYLIIFDVEEVLAFKKC